MHLLLWPLGPWLLLTLVRLLLPLLLLGIKVYFAQNGLNLLFLHSYFPDCLADVFLDFLRVHSQRPFVATLLRSYLQIAARPLEGEALGAEEVLLTLWLVCSVKWSRTEWAGVHVIAGPSLASVPSSLPHLCLTFKTFVVPNILV